MKMDKPRLIYPSVSFMELLYIVEGKILYLRLLSSHFVFNVIEKTNLGDP